MGSRVKYSSAISVLKLFSSLSRGNLALDQKVNLHHQVEAVRFNLPCALPTLSRSLVLALWQVPTSQLNICWSGSLRWGHSGPWHLDINCDSLAEHLLGVWRQRSCGS